MIEQMKHWIVPFLAAATYCCDLRTVYLYSTSSISHLCLKYIHKIAEFYLQHAY